MSLLDRLVDAQAHEAGWPRPEREVCLIPGRRYRWDYVWPHQKVALEVNGGIWRKGGHSTGRGIQRDYDKVNHAVAAGYRPLTLTPIDVKKGKLLEWLRRLA